MYIFSLICVSFSLFMYKYIKKVSNKNRDIWKYKCRLYNVSNQLELILHIIETNDNISNIHNLITNVVTLCNKKINELNNVV